MDNNQSSIINDQSSVPIDYETVWGVPEDQVSARKKPDGFCLIKNISCDCWDNGCLAGECLRS